MAKEGLWAITCDPKPISLRTCWGFRAGFISLPLTVFIIPPWYNKTSSFKKIMLFFNKNFEFVKKFSFWEENIFIKKVAFCY